jgi:hypothetical protein
LPAPARLPSAFLLMPIDRSRWSGVGNKPIS